MALEDSTIGKIFDKFEKNIDDSENNTFKEWEDFGFSEQDLENQIEDYKELSDGQKVLLLENFKQVTLGRVQEVAGEKYNKEVANSGFLKRVWKGISKKYQIDKLEKGEVENIDSSGIEKHQEILRELSLGMKEYGPDAEIRDDGSIEVHYMKAPANFDKRDAEKIK